MISITFKVPRKSGAYVRATVVPSNHSEESRFGVIDGVIVGFFLLCTCGLIFLLLQM